MNRVQMQVAYPHRLKSQQLCTVLLTKLTVALWNQQPLWAEKIEQWGLTTCEAEYIGVIPFHPH